MEHVQSWGRLSSEPHKVVRLHDPDVAESRIRSENPGLPYGMGRSYGDVCLNPGGTLWHTRGLDRFISFDEDEGVLTLESGVLLKEIQDLMVPRGWMLPVTPGTQMITVGGAIANDVHGKNHHIQGTFGHHLRNIRIVRTTGEIIDCGPQHREEWFRATIGGLGHTGLIQKASIRLRKVAGPWLTVETIPQDSLDDFFRINSESEPCWEHTVSWIDCLSSTPGRGIYLRANHSLESHSKVRANDRCRRMPFTPPVSLVSPWTLKPFNFAYDRMNRLRKGLSLQYYESYFYPLDKLLEWNRMYGPKGFFQYQCVVPLKDGKGAVAEMLRTIARSKMGSFLAVLKTFGDQPSIGDLSFPMEGITLALDFPNQGDQSKKLFSRLDQILKDAQGRIYPAKDARMSPDLFRSGYPSLGHWLKFRDPGINSGFIRRMLEEASGD